MSSIRVSAKSTTWTRDIHSLFDYDSRAVLRRKEVKINSSGFVCRQADEVFLIPEEEFTAESEETTVLCYVLLENNQLTVFNSKEKLGNSGIPSEELCLVVRDCRARGFRLSIGNIIKLGKIEIKVNEISGGPHVDIEPESHAEWIPNIIHDTLAEDPLACRICLMEDNEPENPLIAPCNCSGTMGTIHASCLQQWLSSKLTVRESNNSVSYSWKPLECELCTHKYPNSITINGKLYELLSIKRPEGNYVSLEVLPKGNANNVLHFIDVNNKNNVRLGRASESDVRITDISVSRAHATIKNARDGLYLQDNESKFGTVVKIEQSIIVTESLAVQCGRTLLVFKLERRSGCGGCFKGCFGAESKRTDRKNTIESE